MRRITRSVTACRPEFQLRGEFLTSVRGPRSAERSSEEVRVRGGLGPRSEVRARSELGPSAEVMASVRATRSPRSEDQAKKLELREGAR